jgi:hypothetical protein
MVNTFVLHPNLWVNARLLDSEHLGKQRVEAMQILKNVEGNPDSWDKHPVTKMWVGYGPFLRKYINSIIYEWTRRGYQNNYDLLEISEEVEAPWWWHIQAIHFTHQANLYLKDPRFFHDLNMRFNMSIPTIFDNQECFELYTSLGYIWVSKFDDEDRKILASGDFDPRDYAAPLDVRLVDPRYCPGMLLSGARAGQVCGRILSVKDNFCGCHKRKYGAIKDCSVGESEEDLESEEDKELPEQTDLLLKNPKRWEVVKDYRLVPSEPT